MNAVPKLAALGELLDSNYGDAIEAYAKLHPDAGAGLKLGLTEGTVGGRIVIDFGRGQPSEITAIAIPDDGEPVVIARQTVAAAD